MSKNKLIILTILGISLSTGVFAQLPRPVDYCPPWVSRYVCSLLKGAGGVGDGSSGGGDGGVMPCDNATTPSSLLAPSGVNVISPGETSPSPSPLFVLPSAPSLRGGAPGLFNNIFSMLSTSDFSNRVNFSGARLAPKPEVVGCPEKYHLVGLSRIECIMQNCIRNSDPACVTKCSSTRRCVLNDYCQQEEVWPFRIYCREPQPINNNRFINPAL